MEIERVSFSGHETFPFRYTWLKKAVDHLEGQPQLFGQDDAMVLLGVGKNMVYSIRHWAAVCGVIEEDPTVKNNRGRSLRVTEFGRRLFARDGWDPFMEDPATPWLLHWKIASVPENATTWFWVFNQLAQLEFTKADLEKQLLDFAAQKPGMRVTEASLKRDIDVFVRTYVAARPDRQTPLEDTLDCPLVELGLIREASHRGTYLRMRGAHPSLPDGLFVYALASYIGRLGSAANTLSLDDLAYAAGSPGRVFSLSEDGLVQRLERLEKMTGGDLVFDETAGLRQVLIRNRPDAERCLRAYYVAARGGDRQ